MSVRKAAGKSRGRAKSGVKEAKFIHKPNCTTCRKAKNFLERRGFQLYFRDLGKHRLSSAELEKLIGRHNYTNFLNTRSKAFRGKKFKNRPPSRSQAIQMMAKDPNLIRRPVILAGGRVVLGFDEQGMARL